MTTSSEWQDASTGAEANADEWHEVEAEAQIIMEAVLDGFIGRYMGMDPRNPTGIVQGHWTNVMTLNNDHIGEKCFMNVPTDLRNKLKSVPVKALTRIQWIDNLDTGHESGNPMRVFKVQWK